MRGLDVGWDLWDGLMGQDGIDYVQGKDEEGVLVFGFETRLTFLCMKKTVTAALTHLSSSLLSELEKPVGGLKQDPVRCLYYFSPFTSLFLPLDSNNRMHINILTKPTATTALSKRMQHHHRRIPRPPQSNHTLYLRRP